MIEVTGLTRYYGEFAALDNISFRIEKSEIIGLLGLNGAGKSTALKILAGLLAPSMGTVLIEGVNIQDDPTSMAKHIGFLPERPPLYEDMTVTEFLVYIGRLKGMSTSDALGRLPEVIRMCDLKGREDQLISTLSHGYRKRVGIAQAIIHGPKLVILDEPISGLDPAQIVEMRKVIRGLGEGRVVILSSHILGEISQTCDRILVVHDGKLVAQGTESELASHTGGHNKVAITVTGEAAPFHAFLDNSDLVSEYQPIERPDGQASATVSVTDAARADLINALVSASFGLRLVEVPDDELEEIFLGLTKGTA
ncbi:MAG: ATP-binding cassette domain-containing protein [Rhodobacterales bacterium]|nr:ATP-binding cassette domain-containing protein [Rhodobacterales bacterium]